ncbi:hypothetical protein GCM10028805_57680 [Spirosoma harenae]
MGAEVDPAVGPFFLWSSTKKQALLKQLKSWCQQLETEHNLMGAVVFKARLIPPGQSKFTGHPTEKIRLAYYDVVVLVEANTLATLTVLQQSSAYQEIEKAMKGAAGHSHSFLATNVRRISPVNHQRQGVFLFNYFLANDLQQNLAVWEYTAGWFEVETKLTNSTVLQPVDPHQSMYTLVNHCRWDSLFTILPSLLFKPSFHSYVLANFQANQVAPMPILYKLA